MQNNNDFWLGGACGAKGHGKHQLVKLNTYDTQHQEVQFLPAPPKQPPKRRLLFLYRKVGFPLRETLGEGENWRVTAILPHSLSCSLKLHKRGLNEGIF